MHLKCGLLGIEEAHNVTEGRCDRVSALDGKIFSSEDKKLQILL